ncbi:MAG: UDP-N-acetylmuramate--L-alanine ligase [Thermoflexales bacterium]|nr:UDP-N-acetylmuramate--L-alanine ligase [Thermoflexales bacterium]
MNSLLTPACHVHFIGIGGAGLSAIAHVLQSLGYVVSGSDLASNAATESLALSGASVMKGHRAANVMGADLVVASSAVPLDNVEVVEARRRGITLVKRAELLGHMMAGHTGVAVAGTHGKTTTTAMIAQVLLESGQDPSFIVGGVIGGLNANARAGRGPFVLEADEYDRMFLGLRPQIAVVTNVEHDHPDCYPTCEAMVEAFEQFVARLPDDGVLIACWDDPTARRLGTLRQAQGKAVVLYGLDKGAAWRAVDIQANQAGGSDFVVIDGARTVGLIRLRVPGVHNVQNSLAALAVSGQLGVPFDQARNSLREFLGVGRRFEIKGQAGGITVVDDYAHHPSEIRATLAAARARFASRKLWAVFQPHTYSRAKAFLPGFAAAFREADHVIVTEIFAARERDSLGVSGADIVAQAGHGDARYIPSLEDAAAFLLDHARASDVIITLSAGDGNRVGQIVLESLASHEQPTTSNE